MEVYRERDPLTTTTTVNGLSCISNSKIYNHCEYWTFTTKAKARALTKECMAQLNSIIMCNNFDLAEQVAMHTKLNFWKHFVHFLLSYLRYTVSTIVIHPVQMFSTARTLFQKHNVHFQLLYTCETLIWKFSKGY